MHILYIFGSLKWLEAELCLPMYDKSPEGLYTSILHRLLPLSSQYGCMCTCSLGMCLICCASFFAIEGRVKADVYLSV